VGAVAVLAGSGPSFASAQDAIGVLVRAEERYATLDGFCADFRQEIDVTLLRRTIRSAGELCQLPPDRFEMRWSDPSGDRIVADGSYLWAYHPSTNDGQVFRSRLEAAAGRYDLHREFLSNPGQRYEARFDGREEFDGRSCYVLTLRPRAESPYRQATVWIDERDHLIRKLVIVEESESVRTLELTDIRLNPSPAEGWFRFDPPAGVQVITR
jgi:outer membrane lipoprotein carrier protein